MDTGAHGTYKQKIVHRKCPWSNQRGIIILSWNSCWGERSEPNFWKKIHWYTLLRSAACKNQAVIWVKNLDFSETLRIQTLIQYKVWGIHLRIFCVHILSEFKFKHNDPFTLIPLSDACPKCTKFTLISSIYFSHLVYFYITLLMQNKKPYSSLIELYMQNCWFNI